MYSFWGGPSRFGGLRREKLTGQRRRRERVKSKRLESGMIRRILYVHLIFSISLSIKQYLNLL